MKTFRQFIIEADQKDTITFDIPLLIRILEYAREDIKSDPELHKVVEKLIDIRDKGTLTMDDYDLIVKLKEEYIEEMAAAAVVGSVVAEAVTGNSALLALQATAVALGPVGILGSVYALKNYFDLKAARRQ